MKKILSIVLILSLIWINSALAATDGAKTIYIFVKDQAWNIQTQATSTGITLDATAPVINITNNVNPGYSRIWKIITASVSDTNLVSSKYALVNSGVTCSSVTYTSPYISWVDLMFPDESYNGKKICFQAIDRANNITYVESNVIEHIDTIPPVTPTYNYAYQDWYNTISFKWSCTYEEGLKFVVKDNGIVIHQENLSDPCSINFTYTLTAPPLEHTIEYYLTDAASNVSNSKTFKAYIDSIWYLITPANNVTVTPIISFMWFTSTPNATIKIKKIGWDYIATWTADSKWYFVLQTSQSQPLGSMQIDLEINGILRWDMRNITVASSSIVVPSFSNTEAIQRSNTKLITAEVKWQPLSHLRMYAKDSSGNRIELWETDLDVNWNGTIPSSVQLPGWENILYIQDTIYNVSSQILLIVVVDPFWYIYDSITKTKISWAKVYITDCNNNNIVLPNVNGNIQSNPVISNSNWYYDSYELPGTYCLKVEKDWYTWPSTKVLSGALNLDNSINVWSHGQSFIVSNSPIHIDIPMDQIITVSNWWGSSNLSEYDYRSSNIAWQAITSTDTKKMVVTYKAWIKTTTKTYNYWFDAVYIDSGKYYRFMYQKTTTDVKEIPFNQSVHVEITDLDFNNQNVLVKTAEDKEWTQLQNYKINNKTISFDIDKWFLLMIDYNNQFLKKNEIKSEELKVIESNDYVKLNLITQKLIDKIEVIIKKKWWISRMVYIGKLNMMKEKVRDTNLLNKTEIVYIIEHTVENLNSKL